jgi:hypothetical protein
LPRRREAILEKEQRLRTFVCDRLAEEWTPEQIDGRIKAGHERGLRALSVEALDRHHWHPLIRDYVFFCDFHC